jgi:hypothetical protein
MGCLPAHLQDKKHDDWLWPFKYIPRSWTAFCGDPPRKLFGNQETTAVAVGGRLFFYCKPVPQPGEWHINWPPYVAFTTKSRWSFRVGARWNDAAGEAYYSFPAFRIWKLP